MGRRANGEGTYYQRKDGRYCGQLTLKDGRRKSFVNRSPAVVKQQMTQARYQMQQGITIPTEQQSLDQYLAYWLTTIAPTIGASTLSRYRIHVAHIAAVLGYVPLRKLSAPQVQALYSQLLAEGHSPTTVHALHVVLHRALADALRLDLVQRNVADLVKAPRVDHKQRAILSIDQARRLLEAARDERLEALYTLALVTGMREGELLGLRWRDLDLEAGKLTVQTALVYLRGVPNFTAPKTKSARRTIRLNGPTVQALRAHKKRQNEERLAARYWDDLDLVFPNQLGRPIEPGNLLFRWYYPLLEKAGLPKITFHALRHTAATIALAGGASVKAVQEMLGHSSSRITLDYYAHVTESMQEATAHIMEAALFASTAVNDGNYERR